MTPGPLDLTSCSWTVITSIIELAHQLGIVALAGGVETDAQLNVLRSPAVISCRAI